MNFSRFDNIYFLGIGGIGMSALARYFQRMGKHVSGYDKTPTSLTAELESEGIAIHYKDDIALIDRRVISERERSLIIYTPAIPTDHTEYNFFIEKKFRLKKRSEVLGMITEDSFTIAVAGTHGKTTTSSMIAHILKDAGMNCSAFLGGISKNYHTNLLLPENTNEKIYTVVEADEYDRSFLALSPSISVITSMDPDHLDIYGNESYMIESYRLFASKLKPGGTLIYKSGLNLSDIPVGKYTYSVKHGSDYSASNIHIINHKYHFDWNNSSSKIKDLNSEMPGLHNLENAIAAIAVARKLGIPDDKIKSALATYSGVKRRFDYQIRRSDFVYIDDYAHHPEELRACIASAKELYPDWKITGIFQPHLFSRTRDFVDGFAKSLSMLDRLILLDIYPARELPIQGVTSKIIFDKVTIADKIMCSKDEVINELKKNKQQVVLTLGAGDIDQLVVPITKYFQNAS